MGDVLFPIQMAPQYLNQPILPGWQISLFSVNLGQSSDARMEQDIVGRIGSYGKQIGHIAEALEIVIAKLEALNVPLTKAEKDTLNVFLGDAAQIRKLKQQKPGTRRSTATTA